ncbi:MAG TPA: hypothetical protein VKZ18_12385 [Polyangia bacterium]|nr:hypothetical protein [Polyangia bacterium]
MDTSEDVLPSPDPSEGKPTDRVINHPRVALVDVDIFTSTFSPDCMSHSCVCRDDGDTQRNDACCQHGADVLIPEKAIILRRTAEIASIMEPAWRQPARWFDERSPEEDPSAPGGILLRTATVDLDDDSSGCVFLEHTGERGCGLHRAALVHGFDPNEIKPAVCRLYPLSFGDGRLGFSPDFERYSCANDEGPSVYRVMREAVRALFGNELVEALDRTEAEVARRKLRLLPREPMPAEGQPQLLRSRGRS